MENKFNAVTTKMTDYKAFNAKPDRSSKNAAIKTFSSSIGSKFSFPGQFLSTNKKEFCLKDPKINGCLTDDLPMLKFARSTAYLNPIKSQIF